MKALILKAIAIILALVGLLFVIGDVPDTTIAKLAVVKAAGCLMLLVSSKILEKYIPEEA